MTETHSSPPRRAAFIFVFITVLLDMLALGIVIPVLPKLVVDFLAGDTARAAEIYGIFGTVWALMQFVFSPLHGALSDRFGRRPLILLSNFGLGLDYVLMALAPNLWWLFVGRVISGITAASISTAYAYVADVTAAGAARRALRHARRRLRRRLRARPGARRACRRRRSAPAVLDRRRAQPRQRRSMACSCCRNRCRASCARRFEWRRANPLGSFALLRSQPRLLGLAAVTFLGNLAHASLPNIGVLYMMYRYGWDERAVGFTMAGVGVCAMIVQGALIGPVVARFGERTALLAGLVFGVARLCGVRARRDRDRVLGRHPAARALGLRQPGGARADEPPGRPERARPAARRQCEHHGNRQPARPGPVRADLRGLDRRRCAGIGRARHSCSRR